MARRTYRIRPAVLLLCEIFTLVTAIIMLCTGEYNRLLLACATFALVLLPEVMERLLKCRLHPALYYFCVFYALGPMLGHCWDFYYNIPGWDKLLHISGGVVFALVGLFLFDFMGGSNCPPLLRALFALCFSMALSVAWEFFEFFADQVFHTDMQNDTVITALHSHLLGPAPGVPGTISGISSVVVNGTRLPVEGYIDIGLIDTMNDMLVETLGAVVVAVIHLAGRGAKLITPIRS